MFYFVLFKFISSNTDKVTLHSSALTHLSPSSSLHSFPLNMFPLFLLQFFFRISHGTEEKQKFLSKFYLGNPEDESSGKFYFIFLPYFVCFPCALTRSVGVRSVTSTVAVYVDDMTCAVSVLGSRQRPHPL